MRLEDQIQMAAADLRGFSRITAWDRKCIAELFIRGNRR